MHCTFSVTTILHNTDEFIKQGGVWEKEEASREGQDVSGVALFSVKDICTSAFKLSYVEIDDQYMLCSTQVTSILRILTFPM